MANQVEIQCSDYTVLICDDEESIRSMLSEAVSGWGFQVATAPNGEAALEYLQSGQVPHIVLTDIRMGGITGIELAEQVKKMSDEIEVIIMTSHGTFETAVQAMRIGVFDYISKPFENIDDVRTTLVHVAERIFLRFQNEWLMQELTRQKSEIEQLAVMTTDLAQSLDVNRTLEIGVRSLSQVLNQKPVVFFQYLPTHRAFVAATRHPDAIFGTTALKILIPERVGSTQKESIEYTQSLSQNPDFLSTILKASQMSPPPLRQSGAVFHVQTLVTRGILRGFFLFLLPELQTSTLALIDRYVQTITTAFENAILHTKVIQTAIRDGLTNLFNVRYLKERLAVEVATGQRLGHPVSLIFFDVDHFKKYNDTHGHPAGDQVLRMMADNMRKAFRNSDILARYGGEEFVVVMPHTSFVDALEKAEAFRRQVELCPFPNEQTQPLGKVTVSIGVSEFPSHGADMESVIKAADDALYEAKKKSRNVIAAAVAAKGYIPPFSSKPVRSRNPSGVSK